MAAATQIAREVAAKPKPPAIVLWTGLTAGLAAVLVLLLMLFILPSLKSGPKHVPIGVVGEAGISEQLAETLNQHSPDAYDIESVSSTSALRDALEERSLYGGFDLSAPETIDIYVASASSPALAGAITATGNVLADGFALEAQVIDVVPLPASDPTGIGIGGLAFPLVFGGIVPVVAYRSVMAGRRGWILAGLLGFSALSGVVVAAVLQFMFGSIEHSFWPVAAAVALGIAALALPLAGLNECFGGKGFTIGAMTMMFLGNPFAGIATGATWLPAGVAIIGQVLPPGAAGTLVRSVAYFGGAGGTVAALTLSAWGVLGLVLWFLAPRLRVNNVNSGRPGGSGNVG